MALWFFNKVVSFVLAAMLEGILLPSNMPADVRYRASPRATWPIPDEICAGQCSPDKVNSTDYHFADEQDLPWGLMNRPIAASHPIHVVQDRHAGEKETHWEETDKGNCCFKWYELFPLSCPVLPLLFSMAFVAWMTCCKGPIVTATIMAVISK